MPFRLFVPGPPFTSALGNFLCLLPIFGYLCKETMEYKCIITPKMRAVADVLIKEFEGMSHCITDLGRNLVVEVPRTQCEDVRRVLKQQFPDVALIKNAYAMMDDLHDFILVKPLVSEAPVVDCEGVLIPELEKVLVDHESDKEYSALQEADVRRVFQRAFELYPVNTSRLLRYAGRKGKKEEVQQRIELVNKERVHIVHVLQDFFRQEPVERAWLFGSFSRMEERPGSDIDILIDLDKSSPIGLLQYAAMANALEKLLNRKVDLVTNGTVKPFAQSSIDRDKVLIYERA